MQRDRQINLGAQCLKGVIESMCSSVKPCCAWALHYAKLCAPCQHCRRLLGQLLCPALPCHSLEHFLDVKGCSAPGVAAEMRATFTAAACPPILAFVLVINTPIQKESGKKRKKIERKGMAPDGQIECYDLEGVTYDIVGYIGFLGWYRR